VRSKREKIGDARTRLRGRFLFADDERNEKGIQRRDAEGAEEDRRGRQKRKEKDRMRAQQAAPLHCLC
jgi:hypothetical protein